MACAPRATDVIAAILRFGENDLLSYRAEAPVELVARQLEWDAYLDWAAERHGARLAVDVGDPVMSSNRRRPWRRCARPFRRWTISQLAALHVLASITGSLVLGLAVLDGRLTAARPSPCPAWMRPIRRNNGAATGRPKQRAERLAAEMGHAAELVRLSRA